jgi:5'-nucleotidase
MKTVNDVVLVDMDGVIADFNAAFDLAWRSRYPNRELYPMSAQQNLSIVDSQPEEYRADIYDVLSAPGFTVNMPEIEGAVQGIRAMDLMGLQVFICTSPLRDYSHNVPEKFSWVEEHLGQEWARRLIITRDKTVVRGRYLIDDAFVVRGSIQPEWEHFIFDRMLDRSVGDSQKRINWNNWRRVIFGQ